jgi:3-oxoacyl-[acyl-carrier-protein] synthase II
MEAYIRSAGAITPQETFNDGLFEDRITEHNGPWLKCIEPEYKEIINPSLIRRMSRIVKMGVAAAAKSLKDAGIANPDAIITGTGFGCLEDTGTFLNSIFKNKEQFLTPTAFIQSTHNTIGAQIALMIKCNNYNFAYVHRGFSFESALLDAMMLLDEGEAKNVLLGGIDEITQDYWDITLRLGMWKRKPLSNLRLLEDKSAGTLAGEGSVFFVLQKEKEGAYARFCGVDMIFNPATPADIETRIHELLAGAGIGLDDIDTVMLGINGWLRYDKLYQPLKEKMFSSKPILAFKNFCGEYMTASSFAAWLAAGMIKYQRIPRGVLVSGQEPKALKNILIYNHFMGVDHSVMLVSAC